MKLKIGDWLIAPSVDYTWRAPMQLLAYSSLEDCWVCRALTERGEIVFREEHRDLVKWLKDGHLLVCDNLLPPGVLEL